MYWGAPSSVESNSCVLLVSDADSGNPTVVSYDSGVSGSINPIYVSFAPRFAFKFIPPSDDPTIFMVFSNTSFSQSVDVCASGIVLAGEPDFAFSSALP